MYAILILHCIAINAQTPHLIDLTLECRLVWIVNFYDLLLGPGQIKKTCLTNQDEAHLAMLQTIRIYNECEGRIEKSVQRIIVWHHEDCRVMTNGDPEGRIFLSYPHTNNGLFFLFATFFLF